MEIKYRQIITFEKDNKIISLLQLIDNKNIKKNYYYLQYGSDDSYTIVKLNKGKVLERTALRIFNNTVLNLDYIHFEKNKKNIEYE